MRIIGLNHGEFNSSAALAVDGGIVAAAPEERFIRQKKTKNFPKNALQFCLSQQQIKINSVDAIAQAMADGFSLQVFFQLHKQLKQFFPLHRLECRFVSSLSFFAQNLRELTTFLYQPIDPDNQGLLYYR